MNDESEARTLLLTVPDELYGRVQKMAAAHKVAEQDVVQEGIFFSIAFNNQNNLKHSLIPLSPEGAPMDRIPWPAVKESKTGYVFPVGLSPKASGFLQQVAKDQNCTVAEAILSGISLVNSWHEHNAERRRLVFADENNTPLVEIAAFTNPGRPPQSSPPSSGPITPLN